MSALSDVTVPNVGDSNTTGATAVPAVFGKVKDLRDQLAAAVPDDGWLPWTPHLVVNDASAANAYTPSSGANPVLGTGSHVEGRYIKAFGLVVARATIVFGANSTSNTKNDMATNVATERFTRSAADGFTNGMAVIPSNLGTTVISLPSLNDDGSYYVINHGGGGGNDLQLAQTQGGSVVPLTGANATNVTLTAVAMGKGSGPYRLSLPVPATDAENAKTGRAVVGVGQVYDDSEALATFGLGPAVYRHVDLHTAETIESDVAGLINTAGLPITSLQAGGYTLTNHVDSRSLDESSALAPNNKLITSGTSTAASGSTFTDAGANFGTNVLGMRVDFGTYDGIVLRRISTTQLDLGIAHGQGATTAYSIYRDEITALSHVVGTLINDIGVLLAGNVLVDVSDVSPWTWAPNDRITVRLMYEAA